MENRRLTISGVFKEGFNKTFNNFGACLKGMFALFLVGILVLVGFGLANLSLVSKIINQAPSLAEQAKACGDNMECIKTIFWPLISHDIVLFMISSCIALLIYMWLAFGMVRYFLAVHDTGKASVRDLFLPLGKVLKILVASFLALLVVLGGLVLLIIPGIYWGTRLSQFQYFIIDKDAGVIESLKMSCAATDGYSLKLFVLYCIIGMAASLATSIFFLLAIFTVPLQYIMYACMYRSLISQHAKTDEQGNQA